MVRQDMKQFPENSYLYWRENEEKLGRQTDSSKAHREWTFSIWQEAEGGREVKD